MDKNNNTETLKNERVCEMNNNTTCLNRAACAYVSFKQTDWRVLEWPKDIFVDILVLQSLISPFCFSYPFGNLLLVVAWLCASINFFSTTDIVVQSIDQKIVVDYFL